MMEYFSHLALEDDLYLLHMSSTQCHKEIIDKEILENFKKSLKFFHTFWSYVASPNSFQTLPHLSSHQTWTIFF